MKRDAPHFSIYFGRTVANRVVWERCMIFSVLKHNTDMSYTRVHTA